MLHMFWVPFWSSIFIFFVIHYLITLKKAPICAITWKVLFQSIQFLGSILIRPRPSILIRPRPSTLSLMWGEKTTLFTGGWQIYVGIPHCSGSPFLLWVLKFRVTVKLVMRNIIIILQNTQDAPQLTRDIDVQSVFWWFIAGSIFSARKKLWIIQIEISLEPVALPTLNFLEVFSTIVQMLLKLTWISKWNDI